MNQYLKEIGELAELNEMITLKRGGTTVTDKKYNLISTHTARRSFATNAYLARVPSIAIMKITGHRSEKSFMKYIKVDSLQSALNIADHPFFTGIPKERKKSHLRKVG
jgi:integrase